MRSSRSALLAVLAACGTSDPSYQCQTSDLTYATFGDAFVTNWCRGCHSVDLAPGMRQRAPVDMNFDTLADVHAWSHDILVSAGLTTSMPPAGGPSDAERQMLVAWLDCGAP
jgi:uncharacterized membrane protein